MVVVPVDALCEYQIAQPRGQPHQFNMFHQGTLLTIFIPSAEFWTNPADLLARRVPTIQNEFQKR
jgi:hypothetical protein